MKKIILLFLYFISISFVVYAHSGRTDGYGGHYNRSEEKLVVNPDTSSFEVESLKSKVNTLEQQIQAKQDTIGKLNDELDEKNEKIKKLEDKSDEYLAIGFIIFITIIISYNIGKNKK